jgi:DNA repair exonuclease SbcCD ATPase subunit
MEKYLDLFSFFISFNLDENFNEIIKERHYSQFSYDSFSEGEKSRLNLAMLFTFRELIKIKNTAKINLLFLDEIFQSSLDEYGKNVLMEVLFNLSLNGENIFVITHDREIMNDTEYPFSRILQFEVKDNFSSFTEMVDS